METGQGRSTRRSVLGAYVKRLLQDTDLARPLNVVWDPGNGAACPVVERLVRAIPGRHIVLNGEVDGEFPGHHPDPTLPETLEQLRREVHRQHCDLGIERKSVVSGKSVSGSVDIVGGGSLKK